MKVTKVCDLYALIGDNITLRLFSDDDQLLAVYDGHDSIPKEYNDCIVDRIYPSQPSIDYPGELSLDARLDADTVEIAKKRLSTNERDNIICGESYDPDKYRGGVRYFHIDAKTARLLINKGFLDPMEEQNGSPTAQEFIAFIENADRPHIWFLGGYAVCPDRPDYRVTLTDIGTKEDIPLTMQEVLDFSNNFYTASEFRIEDNCASAWWD